MGSMKNIESPATNQRRVDSLKIYPIDVQFDYFRHHPIVFRKFLHSLGSPNSSDRLEHGIPSCDR